MNTLKYILLFAICFSTLNAQDKVEKKEIDTKYREDQLYFSVTYNVLVNKPNNVKQQSFSSGFHAGFIRDMPINKKRTLAIGLGLGLSANTYNQNVRASKTNTTSFEVIDPSTTFSKNTYANYLIELPFELRWRNSTAESYKFWRIYPGFKMGYLFANRTKYIGELGNTTLKSISDFNKLQYGLTLNVGYNTLNAHVYYGLNPLFKSETKLENGSDLNFQFFKVGLMFYIL